MCFYSLISITSFVISYFICVKKDKFVVCSDFPYACVYFKSDSAQQRHL